MSFVSPRTTLNMQTTPSPTESWSWADQISTYRFWGLFAFYLSGVVAISLFAIGTGFLAIESGGSTTTYGTLFTFFSSAILWVTFRQ